jgi:hypothetical protein
MAAGTRLSARIGLGVVVSLVFDATEKITSFIVDATTSTKPVTFQYNFKGSPVVNIVAAGTTRTFTTGATTVTDVTGWTVG